MTDSEILQALKSGDSQGIRNMYEKYYYMIYSLVIRNSGTAQDAEDLFQEVLVVLIRNVRKQGFSLSAKLSSYLYAIGRKMWMYRLRSDKNTVDFELVDTQGYEEIDNPEILEKKEYEQKHHLMATLFKDLSEECQQIIRGFYYQNRPMKELAEELGYTDGSIRVKKNRCMNRFRKLVEAHPDYKLLQQS